MIDTLLDLIPHYGLMILLATVFLACLAVPIPSSMLVLAAGSFAATGDLVLWQVFGAAFIAYVIGDQAAFVIARRAGTPLLAWLRKSPRVEPIITKSEELLRIRGQMAVLISHTILSPTCPYVSYLSGAGGMGWVRFTSVAIPGAAIWSAAYVGLGYIFATELTLVAEILGNFFGVITTGCVVVLSFVWLRGKWKSHLEKMTATTDAETA